MLDHHLVQLVILKGTFKGRKREIMIKIELFIRMLQSYFIVFRKKEKEIWKMLIRCWIGNLNLKSVKTEKF